MNLEHRILRLKSLADSLARELPMLTPSALSANPWFTTEFIDKAAKAIIANYLQEKALTDFVSTYYLNDKISPKKIGIVCAGNIPMVGIHDLIVSYLVGMNIHLKLSEKDTTLMTFVANYLDNNTGQIVIQHRLSDFDAVIATGSDNTARYFHQYFGHVPHVIRKNRTSIAVLDGTESFTDLQLLSSDIFDYFGMGCRNVSYLLVPNGYNFELLFDAFASNELILQHHKYRNNYDYYYASVLINNDQYMSSGNLILLESQKLLSPISMMNYQYYASKKTIDEYIAINNDHIQCVVSNVEDIQSPTVPLGSAQSPSLTNYADGIDIAKFLLSL